VRFDGRIVPVLRRIKHRGTRSDIRRVNRSIGRIDLKKLDRQNLDRSVNYFGCGHLRFGSLLIPRSFFRFGTAATHSSTAPKQEHT